MDKGITKQQIKIIHALKNRLGLTDEEYREFILINSDGWKMSSKELSYWEAERIIQKLKAIAIKAGVWEERPKKYEDLEGRYGMATPRQIRKIEAMWEEIARARDKKRALRRLLEKKFGVSDVKWLEKWQIPKVIKMLEAMRRGRDEEERHSDSGK